MNVKMNFRLITKNHAADSKIRSTKNRFKSRWGSRVPPDSLGVNFDILDIVPFSVTSAGNFTIRYETCPGFSEVNQDKSMVPFGFQLKEDVSIFPKND